MITGLDFRRLRRWELALAAFALSAPFLLPAFAPGAPSFIRPAMAEDMLAQPVSSAMQNFLMSGPRIKAWSNAIRDKDGISFAVGEGFWVTAAYRARP